MVVATAPKPTVMTPNLPLGSSIRISVLAKFLYSSSFRRSDRVESSIYLGPVVLLSSKQDNIKHFRGAFQRGRDRVKGRLRRRRSKQAASEILPIGIVYHNLENKNEMMDTNDRSPVMVWPKASKG